MNAQEIKQACPSCGKVLDAATPVGWKGMIAEQAPEPGDLSICLYCSNVMVYGDDLRLRSPTIDELLDFLDDQRVEDAIRASLLWRKEFAKATQIARGKDTTRRLD